MRLPDTHIKAIEQALITIGNAAIKLYSFTALFQGQKEVAPYVAAPIPLALDKVAAYTTALAESIRSQTITTTTDINLLFSRAIEHNQHLKHIKQSSFLPDLQAAFMIDLLIKTLKHIGQSTPFALETDNKQATALSMDPIYVDAEQKIVAAMRTLHQILINLKFDLLEQTARHKLLKDEEMLRRIEIQDPEKTQAWAVSQAEEQHRKHEATLAIENGSLDRSYLATSTSSTTGSTTSTDSAVTITALTRSWTSIFAERHEDSGPIVCGPKGQTGSPYLEPRRPNIA